jgi:hypothetical protein
MKMYTYIAANNPYFVKSLAHKYGHELKNNANLSLVLEQIVGLHGEPALYDILENHPDKQVMGEYLKEKGSLNFSGGEDKVNCGGGCSGCKEKMTLNASSKPEYMNMSGDEMYSQNKKVVQNTSVMMLAGAVIIAFAILNLKN